MSLEKMPDLGTKSEPWDSPKFEKTFFWIGSWILFLQGNLFKIFQFKNRKLSQVIFKLQRRKKACSCVNHYLKCRERIPFKKPERDNHEPLNYQAGRPMNI